MRTAPLVSRWIERLLAGHEPPLTVAQYLALQAVGEGEVVGAELARRTAVSPAAVSQLLAALEKAGSKTAAATRTEHRRSGSVSAPPRPSARPPSCSSSRTLRCPCSP